MALRLLAATFETRRPVPVAQFWASLLGRDIVEHAGGILLPGDDRQLGLRFVSCSTAKSGVIPSHLHMTSVSTSQQHHTVATALELGASHSDIGQNAEDGHIVLADPDGNEFCVAEPHNSYLVGCGFLGELACDGSRAVGLFWREALGWPLVWDLGQETAIQSSVGGTKVSWGGEPEDQDRRRPRQRLYVVPVESDRRSEVDRLVSLGATRHTANDDITVLVDPDGIEFDVGDY